MRDALPRASASDERLEEPYFQVRAVEPDALAECALSRLFFGLFPDRMSDRELAGLAAEPGGLIETAAKGSIIECQVFEDVSPPIQTGIKHRDARHAAPQLLPLVHEPEAGGGVDAASIEASQKKVKMESAEHFALFIAEHPQKAFEGDAGVPGALSQEGVPHVVTLAPGKLHGSESERSEELPMNAVEDVDFGKFH